MNNRRGFLDKIFYKFLCVVLGVLYGTFGALYVAWNFLVPFVVSRRTRDVLGRILRGIYFVLRKVLHGVFVICYGVFGLLYRINLILITVCIRLVNGIIVVLYRILYGVLYLICTILYRKARSTWEALNSPFTPTFTESPAQKLTDYLFDEESKKEKSLLVRCFAYVFGLVSKRFLGSSLQVRFLFLYFLLILYLVVENYEWVLAPFARETSFANDYTILFRLTDREANPVVHGVYSISWIYVTIVVWVLCLNLSPERLLRHQYLLCLVPYFRSYFLAASSNVFLIIAIMIVRAAVYFGKPYVWIMSLPVIFCMVSLFLLDITVCFEDLGKDNIFGI